MKVKVRIIGVLKRPRGKDTFELDLPEGAKIKDLLEKSGFDSVHAAHILTAVNGDYKKHFHKLEDGDEVLLSMIVGGG